MIEQRLLPSKIGSDNEPMAASRRRMPPPLQDAAGRSSPPLAGCHLLPPLLSDRAVPGRRLQLCGQHQRHSVDGSTCAIAGSTCSPARTPLDSACLLDQLPVICRDPSGALLSAFFLECQALWGSAKAAALFGWFGVDLWLALFKKNMYGYSRRAGQGVKLLNILGKYCEAFSSMVEGKNKVSTDQLSGGARIHYIFQSIFVKSLEEVDPCKNISDEDIHTSIQNSDGPKGAMFLPEVPFEILIRRQIGRLLDPSLQCAKFIYDELVKISHGCLTSELQKYPILKRRMSESVSNFLRDGLRPAETMITHIIEMEMDYINTSHSSFVGGSKVIELAKHECLSSRGPTSLLVHKDGIGISSEVQLKSSGENNIQLKSERGQKSRAVFPRDTSRGATSEKGFQPDSDAGTSVAGRGQNGHSLVGGSSSSMSDPRGYSLNSLYSMIRLREPPSTLKPSENKTDQDRTEIAIVKLLIKSYYDIVRKSIEDAVPKAIMHFLVNHTKRELHNVLIRKLYRENLLDDMLRETDEVLIRRQHIQETLKVLEQAHRTLEEFPLEAEKLERGYSLSEYATGLPIIHGLSNRNPMGILP